MENIREYYMNMPLADLKALMQDTLQESEMARIDHSIPMPFNRTEILEAVHARLGPNAIARALLAVGDVINS